MAIVILMASALLGSACRGDIKFRFAKGAVEWLALSVFLAAFLWYCGYIVEARAGRQDWRYNPVSRSYPRDDSLLWSLTPEGMQPLVAGASAYFRAATIAFAGKALELPI